MGKRRVAQKATKSKNSDEPSKKNRALGDMDEDHKTVLEDLLHLNRWISSNAKHEFDTSDDKRKVLEAKFEQFISRLRSSSNQQRSAALASLRQDYRVSDVLSWFVDDIHQVIRTNMGVSSAMLSPAKAVAPFRTVLDREIGFSLPSSVTLPPSQVVDLLIEFSPDTTIKEYCSKGMNGHQDNNRSISTNLTFSSEDLNDSGEKAAPHMTRFLSGIGRDLAENYLIPGGQHKKKGECDELAINIPNRKLKAYQCREWYCKFTTTTLFQLHKHRRRPHYKYCWNCAFCRGFAVNKYESLEKHYLKVHGYSSALLKEKHLGINSCLDCSTDFKSKKRLDSHIRLGCFMVPMEERDPANVFCDQNSVDVLNLELWPKAIHIRPFWLSLSGPMSRQYSLSPGKPLDPVKAKDDQAAMERPPGLAGVQRVNTGKQTETDILLKKRRKLAKEAVAAFYDGKFKKTAPVRPLESNADWIGPNKKEREKMELAREQLAAPSRQVQPVHKKIQVETPMKMDTAVGRKNAGKDLAGHKCKAVVSGNAAEGKKPQKTTPSSEKTSTPVSKRVALQMARLDSMSREMSPRSDSTNEIGKSVDLACPGGADMSPTPSVESGNHKQSLKKLLLSKSSTGGEAGSIRVRKPIQHNGLSFSCDTCDAKFVTAMALAKHKHRWHSKELSIPMRRLDDSPMQLDASLGEDENGGKEKVTGGEFGTTVMVKKGRKVRSGNGKYE